MGHGGPGSTGPGRFFFDWLTDPVKNCAGALMDFGCYMVDAMKGNKPIEGITAVYQRRRGGKLK